MRFEKLGHFSLDSNERSAYQARELKTVYVPQASEGQYLKLLLHKCHVNEHNLYSQLGVLAVRAIGTGPGAGGTPVATAEPLSALALKPPQMPRGAPAASPGGAALAALASKPRGEIAIDGAVVSLLQEAHRAKEAAVAAERYDEATELKERITRLRTVGVRLAELEREKRAAIGAEDYGRAKTLKEQSDELRQAEGVPSTPALAPPNGHAIERCGVHLALMGRAVDAVAISPIGQKSL